MTRFWQYGVVSGCRGTDAAGNFLSGGGRGRMWRSFCRCMWLVSRFSWWGFLTRFLKKKKSASFGIVPRLCSVFQTFLEPPSVLSFESVSDSGWELCIPSKLLLLCRLPSPHTPLGNYFLHFPREERGGGGCRERNQDRLKERREERERGKRG